MSVPDLANEIDQKISEIISWDGIVHIAYVSNSDAIIAASIIARVFHDLGKPFVLYCCDQLNEQLEYRGNQFTIFVGITFEQAMQINQDKGYLCIVEPENAEPSQENILNSADYGYLRPEVTLAALAYLLVEAIAESTDYIIYLPLVAAQSVNLYMDYKGLCDIIAQHAQADDIISMQKQFSFLGSNVFSISEAIIYSQNPFLPGLTGNERMVTQLLLKADINEETTSGIRTLAELDKEEIRALNSTLVVHLSQYKGHQEDQLEFIRTKTVLLHEDKDTILANTWDFAQAINDAVNRGRVDLAISVLIGNRGDKLRELTKLFKEERKGVLLSYNLLLDKREEIIELKYLRYLQTDKRVNWYNTSIVAAMGLANGLVTVDLPFAVVAPGPDQLSTLGIRMSKNELAKSGLKEVVQEVLKERNIQVPVAGSLLSAQVSLPSSEVENILLDLNGKIGEWFDEV